MAHRWNHIAQFMALGAACSLIVWIGTSIAQDEQSVLVNEPVASIEEGPALPGPALPPPSNPAKDAGAPKNDVVPSTPNETAKPRTAMPTKRPFMRPAVPKDLVQGELRQHEAAAGPDAQLTAAEEPMPPPEGAEVIPPAQAAPPLDIRPTPPIEYDTDGDARDMYRDSGEVEVVMLTQNPADGCYYEIPMCIPGCCVGEPSVSGGRGIFGRGVVEYCWPCGFRAEVKFRQILGDVKVEYEGD